MTQPIRDEDVRILARLAGSLEGDYVSPEDDPWKGSPFAWILTTSSRQRGKIGEQLIAGWCAAKGLDVTKSGNSEADRVIGGQRMEIKFSRVWKSGVMKFQQIRDQDYSFVMCLGLAPFDANAWVIPKASLREHFEGRVSLEGLSHQHGGRVGRDTWWLSFPWDSPPLWLAPYGGSLSQAFRALQRIAR